MHKEKRLEAEEEKKGKKCLAKKLNHQGAKTQRCTKKKG